MAWLAELVPNIGKVATVGVDLDAVITSQCAL